MNRTFFTMIVVTLVGVNAAVACSVGDWGRTLTLQQPTSSCGGNLYSVTCGGMLGSTIVSSTYLGVYILRPCLRAV